MSICLLGGSEKNYEPPSDYRLSWDRALKREVCSIDPRSIIRIDLMLEMKPSQGAFVFSLRAGSTRTLLKVQCRHDRLYFVGTRAVSWADNPLSCCVFVIFLSLSWKVPQ